MPDRVALLLGSYAYAQEPNLQGLRGPPNDIAALESVLGNPEIGGFATERAINEPANRMQEQIEAFLADRQPDDVVLLYFSGHGVRDFDADGKLYLAAANTRLAELQSTALRAADINELLCRCRARHKLLILDCSHSGVFGRDAQEALRGMDGVGTRDAFADRSVAVLTGSDAFQHAFADGRLQKSEQEVAQSYFTRALVEGLFTGSADRDGDGWVAFDELHEHIEEQVRTRTPGQAPRLWTLEQQGRLVVARGKIKPAKLPENLSTAFNDARREWLRKSAIDELLEWMGEDPGRVLAARLMLERLCKDDHEEVRVASRKALEQRAWTQRSDIPTFAAARLVKPAPERAAAASPQPEPAVTARTADQQPTRDGNQDQANASRLAAGSGPVTGALDPAGAASAAPQQPAASAGALSPAQPKDAADTAPETPPALARPAAHSKSKAPRAAARVGADSAPKAGPTTAQSAPQTPPAVVQPAGGGAPQTQSAVARSVVDGEPKAPPAGAQPAAEAGPKIPPVVSRPAAGSVAKTPPAVMQPLSDSAAKAAPAAEKPASDAAAKTPSAMVQPADDTAAKASPAVLQPAAASASKPAVARSAGPTTRPPSQVASARTAAQSAPPQPAASAPAEPDKSKRSAQSRLDPAATAVPPPAAATAPSTERSANRTGPKPSVAAAAMVSAADRDPLADPAASKDQIESLAAAVRSATGPHLEVISGVRPGLIIPLIVGDSAVTEWTVGSHVDREVRLLELGVSAAHAKLVNEGSRWKVVDQMSAGGTYVNGKRANVGFINSGDRLRFGPVECIFHQAQGPARVPAARQPTPRSNRARLVTAAAAVSILAAAVLITQRNRLGTPPGPPEVALATAPPQASAADIAVASSAQPSTAPGGAGASASINEKGAEIYALACIGCHGEGLAGAPRVGDTARWAPRIAQGIAVLQEHSLQGFQGLDGYMPPRGGRVDLSDQAVMDAVDYMVAQSK